MEVATGKSILNGIAIGKLRIYRKEAAASKAAAALTPEAEWERFEQARGQAQEQLAAIRKLRSQGLLESLPGKLRQAAAAREENPESALTELAQMMEPPITKSAMSHRLKKLVELAGEGSL